MLRPDTCHDIFFPPHVDLFTEITRRLTLFRPRIDDSHIDFDVSFIGNHGGSDAALHVSSICAKRLAARA